LNRELDPQVLNIAEEMGLKVFPKQWADFKMQCNCPDWAVPCKHLAAVIYKVSAAALSAQYQMFKNCRAGEFCSPRDERAVGCSWYKIRVMDKNVFQKSLRTPLVLTFSEIIKITKKLLLQ